MTDTPETPRESRPRGAQDRTCSTCGSTDVVPVAYGLPTRAEHEAAARGEVVLGGCSHDDRSAWHCRACGESRDEPRPMFGAWHPDTDPAEIVAWLKAQGGVDD